MSKSREAMQIQVGAFVAIGLFLTMLVIFLLGGEKKLFESQYSLICRFGNISGLRVGAPVQLAGIQVGTVRNIEFDDEIKKKKVKLTLRISKSYQNRIREDSLATVETQGLLGDRMVFISVGSSDKEELKNGGELTTRPPAGFSDIIEKGDVLLDNVNDIAKNLKDIMKEVRKGSGVIHGLVYDPEGEDLVTDIKLIMENLGDATGNIKRITSKINRGKGTLGALVNDASLFNDMKTLLGKANRNKLIRAVVRELLKTRDERLLERPQKQTLKKSS